MKTIFISTSRPGRARPDYFFALADSFVKKGYQVVMILDGKIKDFPKQKNILFYTWPTKRPTKAADFLFLIKLIKKYRPGILISSFGSVNVMNFCGYVLNVKNRINFILSVSEPFYEKVSCGKILYHYFLKIRKRYIYKLATLLVCNSDGTLQDSKNFYNLSQKEFLVLHNLIRNSLVNYTPQVERKLQILIVGSLIKRKGHNNLLKQFRETLKEFPSMKLIIVGEGIEKNNLQSKVKDLEISENVVFTGEIPNKNIAKYFSESLISISASYHEAFGFVNIEAMREGTPLVSTKTAGGMEVVKEGINGCYFDLKGLESLTNSVKIILGNWEEYSQNSIKLFMDFYSLEEQIDRHRDLLMKYLK
ncbi:glycosyltransferase family 4 protein [Aequorivita sinensis]|uniref:glycosyltransferase family 4 protein n=1 Tax=Aequorivita sinensis TaxID=1382458 RepID=UPI0023008981|nr:glycosyltransferase family 4 protein [Aequorivita sinensis]